jgi:hypothetical protein
MTALYFLINAIETALLAVYFYLSGSAPSEQVFLGLSPERLILVCGLAVLALAFLGAAVLSFKNGNWLTGQVHTCLKNERTCWRMLAAGLLMTAVVIFLFTRGPHIFGDWSQVYVQFQPVLSLIFLFSIQTVLVLLVWIAFHFTNFKPESDKEIRRIWIVFAVLAAFKYFLGTAGAYGPINGDEMEYFSLAYYLSQGNLFQAVDPIHYPPLYSLLLTTTLPFGFYTFDLIKVINVLLSSSIVFPIYLISRRYMKAEQSLLVVLGASLLPFHLIFPRRIQSENLYFPLFYWALYFIVSDPQDKRRRSAWDILSGALLGMLYLTRYITLALLPVFLLGWGLKVSRNSAGSEQRASHWIRRFLLLAVCGLGCYLPWIAAGLSHGYVFRDTLGLFITASVENPQQLSFANLMLWVLIYAAYLVLMAAPVLPFLFLLARDFFTNRLSLKSKHWFILSIALTAVYSAAVVRHSWRANYNAEIPMKIMGRYLIFLAPIFLISAMLALRERKQNEPPATGQYGLLMLIIPAGLISGAYLLLIRKSILPISAGALNALGAVDGYLVSLMGEFFFLLLLPLYGSYLLLYLKKKIPALLAAAALGLAVFYLAALPAYQGELKDQQYYNRIGEQTAKVLAGLDVDLSGAGLQLLLPNELTSIQKQQIYMTVQVRGLPLLTPASYNSARQFSDIEENTLVIWDSQNEWSSPQEPIQSFSLSGTPYLLKVF